MRRIAPYTRIALTLLAATGAALAATTYRWVDAQGVVHYSDTPQPGAEKIQLPSAQTYTAAPAAPGPPAASESKPAAAPYRSCDISQPTPEQAFFAPESVDISVALNPALRAGDRVIVTLDGGTLEPLDPSGLSFVAPQPLRGTHTVSAVVRDSTGKMLCSSASITFYIQRPSDLSPASPVRPH